MSLPPELLERLLDDASQFPPGNLPLEPAVEAHAAWRRDARASFVGRFLLPADRAAAFSGEGFDIGVVVKGADGAVDAAVSALRALEGQRVTAVELPLPDDPGSLSPLEGVPVFLETDADGVAAVAGVAGAGAKLRCGGPEAAAFPSVERATAFVEAAAGAGVAFKATAGLHEPLRHFDRALGVHHHGFLNLWVATALALRGEGSNVVRSALAVDEAADVRAADGELRFGEVSVTHDELLRARSAFTAFGTCSIEEPLAGLARLGLVDLAVA